MSKCNYAHRYDLWEDYLNGMFNDDIRFEKVQEAINILGNAKECERTMTKVLNEYICAAETNLMSDLFDDAYSSKNAWLRCSLL